MKLSVKQLADFILWFSPRQAATRSLPRLPFLQFDARNCPVRLGTPILSVRKPQGAELMARARILPRASSKRQSASCVSVRNVGPSGIVIVDAGYWLDGEQFLLILPERADMQRPARGVLCTVTHWTALNAQQFLVSARFDRLIGAFEPGLRGKLQPASND